MKIDISCKNSICLNLGAFSDMSGQFFLLRQKINFRVCLPTVISAISHTIIQSFFYFGQVFQKLWQYKYTLTTFWHVLFSTMVISRDSRYKLVIFFYPKSYSPFNFRKTYQILWFCCVHNRSYKEDNLRAGRICPPPLPLVEWGKRMHSLISDKSCFLRLEKAMRTMGTVGTIFSLAVLTNKSRKSSH